MRQNRIDREIKKLLNESLECEIGEMEKDTLTIFLTGPEGTKYENNKYEISFEFPEHYPFRAPRIKFKTPIDFPLFNRDGKVDVFSLFGEDYAPDIYIKDIIERIIFFMSPGETRIDTYKDRHKRFIFEKKPITQLINEAIGHSFKPNEELAFVGSNVPVLEGFY